MAGSVVSSAADGVFGSIVKAFNKAFGDALTLMSTFWLKIPTPQLSSTAGPVGALTGNLAWLTGAVAVAGILVAAIRMAVLRSSRPAVDLAKGLGRLVFAVFALLPLMALGASLGDEWSTWIVSQGTGGDFAGHVAGIVSGLAALSPGLLLVIAILGVLSALLQVVFMLVRVGVLIVLAGALPTLAAGSSTHGGEHAYKRALAWAAAFLLYKPLAATLFAGAFLRGWLQRQRRTVPRRLDADPAVDRRAACTAQTGPPGRRGGHVGHRRECAPQRADRRNRRDASGAAVGRGRRCPRRRRCRWGRRRGGDPARRR